MMSLTEVSIADIVKRQYSYKLKGYLSVFTSMIFIQLLAMFFSAGGTSSMGTSSDSYSIDIKYFSGSLIIIFTMLWAFITAILITTKAYRNDDFTFITNRLSSNLSNIVFLVTASIIGGITAMLSGTLLKVVMYFVLKSHEMVGNTTIPTELLFGMITTSFYLILLCSLGYFVGTLTQVSKIFVILIPTLFFGVLFLGYRIPGITNLGKWIQGFLLQETSIVQFIFKVLIISGLLFLLSVVFSNRMEVRR